MALGLVFPSLRPSSVPVFTAILESSDDSAGALICVSTEDGQELGEPSASHGAADKRAQRWLGLIRNVDSNHPTTV